MLFDYELTKGNDKFTVSNDPTGGISFAGVRRGNAEALVTAKRFARPAPFQVTATDELTAPFELKGDKLTLDLSKSLKASVPEQVREMKIDWSKMTWERVKK